MTKTIEDAMVDIGSVSRGIQKHEHAPRQTLACSCIQQKEIIMGSLEGIDFVALIETILGLIAGGGEEGGGTAG